MCTHTHTQTQAVAPGSARLEEDVTDRGCMCPCHSEPPSRRARRRHPSSRLVWLGRAATRLRGARGSRGPSAGSVLQGQTSRAHPSSPGRRHVGVQGPPRATAVRGPRSGPPAARTVHTAALTMPLARSELSRPPAAIRIASLPLREAGLRGGAAHGPSIRQPGPNPGTPTSSWPATESPSEHVCLPR